MVVSWVMGLPPVIIHFSWGFFLINHPAMGGALFVELPPNVVDDCKLILGFYDDILHFVLTIYFILPDIYFNFWANAIILETCPGGPDLSGVHQQGVQVFHPTKMWGSTPLERPWNSGIPNSKVCGRPCSAPCSLSCWTTKAKLGCCQAAESLGAMFTNLGMIHSSPTVFNGLEHKTADCVAAKIVYLIFFNVPPVLLFHSPCISSGIRSPVGSPWPFARLGIARITLQGVVVHWKTASST